MILVMKWVTVIAYLGTAVVCALRAKRNNNVNLQTNHRKFWPGMAVMMLLLGINKQQGGIGWFTQALRRHRLARQLVFSRSPVQLSVNCRWRHVSVFAFSSGVDLALTPCTLVAVDGFGRHRLLDWALSCLRGVAACH